MGEAITYAQNNWEALSVFLKDPKVRLDNNISEGQLRIIALGRKNFLFLGNDVAGENLAVLQTLISTCIINEVNPIAYLTDVLIRIQDHPMSQVDELLPQHWQYLDTS
ncbi:MAG: transposase, partial [Bradymonadales bacterium]|nr:transposase [Bradymonadales bacterium]